MIYNEETFRTAILIVRTNCMMYRSSKDVKYLIEARKWLDACQRYRDFCIYADKVA